MNREQANPFEERMSETETGELIAKLRHARANGDPKKYTAMISVYDAHRIADLLEAALEWHPTHRHLKSGHLVREIGRGFAQVSIHPIEEMTGVSIYEHDGRLWVRNAVEFDDGRFEELVPPEGR
jgi:hypothetical protein